MSYRGPLHKVLEHRRRADGRYTGALLDCQHEVVFQRTQAKPSDLAACYECKGTGRWGKKAATPAKATAPQRPSAESTHLPPAPPSMAYAPLANLEGRLLLLEDEVRGIRLRLDDSPSPFVPKSPVFAPPKAVAQQPLWESEAIERVRLAVVALFSTRRGVSTDPRLFEEALEKVESAARVAGWFDDANAKSPDPRVSGAESKRRSRAARKAS